MERNQQIRPYEISLWTLQDSFITILKWGNFDQKGQVQESIQKIDIDGTEELSFSIPMYLSQIDSLGNDIKKENPIWYNVKNGNLIANLRKVKVIINKHTDDEEVYEFIINKVSERHEEQQLYCDVECEGLAFNELGKTGYKISLSQDDFYNDYEDWFKSTSGDINEPHQTIQYWNNKFLEPYDKNNVSPNKWYYEVNMNWDASINNNEKDKNKVYEEEYVSSWETRGNNVYPKVVSTLKEKERPVNIQESNIYNITQKIAEIFGVFCKYKYEYDENYHIISKRVIYYNNLIEEKKGHIDITYPYHTSKIIKESDSANLTTKMFVRIPDSNDKTLSIMNVDANRSKEDYILNFDYLYNLNIISEEQYSEIKNFENNMFKINKELQTLNNEINIISDNLLKEKSNLSIAQKSKISAEEQMNTAVDHLNKLGDNPETGIVKVQGFNAKTLIMIQNTDTNFYYVSMPFTGIIPSTVKLYAGILSYNYQNSPLENCTEVTNYDMEYDEYLNLTKIINLSEPSFYGLTSPILWLECEYLPYNYWVKVRDYWVIDLNNQNEIIDKATLNINRLNNDLVRKENRYNQLLEKKQIKIKEFEYIMGPALREGYWQPEDYFNYNERFIGNFFGPNQAKQEHAIYKWDDNLLDGEDKITFRRGNDTYYYLMIRLNGLDYDYIKNNYEKLSFIYYDNKAKDLGPISIQNQYINQVKKVLHSIHLNGGCKLGFIYEQNNQNLELVPVLIITDSSLFSNEQLEFFYTNTNTSYNCKLGTLDTELEDNEIITYLDLDSIVISKERFIRLEKVNETTVKYSANLRVLIDTLLVDTSSSELFLKLNNQPLKEYEDFYIIKDYSNVYITIKPESIYKNYSSYILLNPKLKIVYSLSNTETSIYLDAIEVAKENAYPKVSYTVDLSIYQPQLIHNIYKKLSHIVHINDVELKFKNVQGYISRVELDLDHPWKDKIEVKNYKTKFEDLFSTIVASTETIKKNSTEYSAAAKAFNLNGTLKNEAVAAIFNDNSSVINNYLDSNLKDSEFINRRLEELFNEAGLLLSGANTSLSDVRSLSTSNANILSGFYAGVQAGFNNGIDYTNDYNFTSAEGNGKVNISAVRINKDEGIFIGSNKKIVLSATNAIKDVNGNYIGDPAIEHSGANVELTPSRLLMGVSNFTSNNDGVVDITSDQIILAVGNNASQLENSSEEITNLTNLSGVQIKKDYIGLATGSGNNRSIVSIKPSDISLGVVNNNKTGSYVKIAQTGIEIGSNADIWINTNNLAIKTDNQSNRIFRLGSENNYDLLYTSTDGLSIKGAIQATSFILGNGVKIQQGNNTDVLGSIQNQLNDVNAISGTVSYAISNNGSNIPNDWPYSSPPSVNQGEYLWTRTIITYSGGNSSPSYSVSYVGTNGTNGKYITSIQELYYLKKYRDPSQPDSLITYSLDTKDTWTTIIPNYEFDCIYYRCKQYKWSDNSYTWSTYYRDDALTYPNKVAKKFEVNGLIMDYSWGGITYPVALTSSQNLLIGATSGVTIAKSDNENDGAAVIINNNGISLLGKTINLKAAGATESSIILSENGINIQTAGHIKMTSGGTFDIVATEGQMSFGTNNNVNFSVDKEGNIYCKNLSCSNIISDNFYTVNGVMVAQDQTEITPTTEVEVNSETTYTFSPSSGYLPGGGGSSGSFTTTAVFTNGAPYEKADIYLYFTNIGSQYWTIGHFQLFVNNIAVYSSATDYRAGATLILAVNDVNVTKNQPIRLRATSSISNQASYSSSFTFKPNNSYVICHS